MKNHPACAIARRAPVHCQPQRGGGGRTKANLQKRSQPKPLWPRNAARYRGEATANTPPCTSPWLEGIIGLSAGINTRLKVPWNPCYVSRANEVWKVSFRFRNTGETRNFYALRIATPILHVFGPLDLILRLELLDLRRGGTPITLVDATCLPEHSMRTHFIGSFRMSKCPSGRANALLILRASTMLLVDTVQQGLPNTTPGFPKTLSTTPCGETLFPFC